MDMLSIFPDDLSWAHLILKSEDLKAINEFINGNKGPMHFRVEKEVKEVTVLYDDDGWIAT